MLSFLDYYLVPFGLFLGATTPQIAVLVAVPHLLSAMAQLFAVGVVRRVGSRLKLIVRGAALQAALFIPTAFLAVIPSPRRVQWLPVLIAGIRMMGSLVGAAWGSLVSEYLPPERRGSYFGWRARVVGIAGVVGVVCGGLLLTWLGKFSTALGFFLLFLLAGVLRFISAALLAQMTELPHSFSPGSDFTLLMFLRRMKKSNFVRFVLFTAGVIFAAHIAAPYFSVYLLRGLHWSYLQYMWIHLAAVIAGLVAFPVWGRHADFVGNAHILKLTGFLIPLIPFLWLFSESNLYLFGVELFSGFVWGGFNLCAANFIYDAVTPQKRVRCLAYFNLINGTAIFIGSLLGGFLADRLPPIRGHSLLTLFALSGLLRLGACFFLSSRFQEVRASARRVSSRRLFFSVLGIRPLLEPETE